MKRSTGGILAAAGAVLAFSAVGVWLLGSSVRAIPARAVTVDSGSRSAARSSTNSAAAPSQPPPTSSPNSPGIVIADSNGFDLPDPFVLAADGEYYMYLSTAFGDPTRSNVPMLIGSPGHWGPVSDAMPQVPDWAVPASQGGKTWDPYVVYLGGRYVMYSAPQLLLSPSYARLITHCLSVAVSASPAGPFVPEPGPPLLCQAALGGDIDSQLFYDPHGPDGPGHPYYLIWKSDNNNLLATNQTTVWAAPLTNDGLQIAGPPVAIFSPDEAWEKPVLEAPQMVESPGGTDWLFFSAGTGFYTSRYAIGVAECSGPLGGCHEVYDRPLIASNSQGPGPGEETVFAAPEGSTWLLYSPWHTMDPVAPFRPVEAARIGWDSNGPYIAEAGAFPPALSGLGLQLFSGVSDSTDANLVHVSSTSPSRRSSREALRWETRGMKAGG